MFLSVLFFVITAYQFLLLLRWPVITAYQLPTPYFAKPPYSFGYYCNDTDLNLLQGYLFVDVWATVNVSSNSVVQVTQLDAIEIKNDARLIASPMSRVILQNSNRARFFSDITLKNFSSLSLTDNSDLESNALGLGQNARFEMARFAMAAIKGSLRLDDRSILIIIDFSKIQVATEASLVLSSGGSLKIEGFSSLSLNSKTGLRIEPGFALILRNHSTFQIATNTWIRLTRNVTLLDKTDIVISSADKNQIPGFEYASESEFEK